MIPLGWYVLYLCKALWEKPNPDWPGVFRTMKQILLLVLSSVVGSWEWSFASLSLFFCTLNNESKKPVRTKIITTWGKKQSKGKDLLFLFLLLWDREICKLSQRSSSACRSLHSTPLHWRTFSNSELQNLLDTFQSRNLLWTWKFLTVYLIFCYLETALVFSFYLHKSQFLGPWVLWLFNCHLAPHLSREL